MTNYQKLQSINKYIKELRDNRELHERLLRFREDQEERIENEKKTHHDIAELTTKNHYFKSLLVHLDVEQDKALIKPIQLAVKQCDYKIQRGNATLSVFSDLIEEKKNLIKLYENGADRLFYNIWNIERAVEIHKLSLPDWEYTIDMDHYEKTGRIKNKKITIKKA